MIDNWTEDRQRLLLEAALTYTDAGWPVVPLHTPHPHRVCTCADASDCASPGKHPRTFHGLHDASTDPSQVERWWRQWPAANIGLRTGVAFDVIDVDSEAGAQALIAAQQGDWISGPKVSTGKGWHLYLQPSGVNNRTGIVPGVDYRGTNGYVVAPPSAHPSGREYKWLANMATPLEPIPRWFEPILVPPAPVVERKAPPVRAAVKGYAEKALELEVRAVLQAGEGGRNHQLNRSAFNLGQLVGGGQLDRADVEAVLRHAASTIGLTDAEITKTLNSGITKGMERPRQSQGLER